MVFPRIENAGRSALCNNSHSCLITPNGRVLGQWSMSKPATFSPAARSSTTCLSATTGHDLLYPPRPLFARLCVLVTLACWLWLLKAWHVRKRRQYQAIKASRRDTVTPPRRRFYFVEARVPMRSMGIWLENPNAKAGESGATRSCPGGSTTAGRQ